jgi:hypothetical protein
VYLALLLALTAPCVAQSPDPPEARERVPLEHLKLVFLYNFAKFVEWPAAALGEAGTPLTIGVLDQEPFKDFLGALKAKTAQGRPIRFRQCDTPESMLACHILYLNDPSHLRVQRMLTAVGDNPVLTVGDSRCFNRWGGVVRFSVAADTLRLAVNPAAARKAGLVVSAQLMEVCDVFTPAEGP